MVASPAGPVLLRRGRLGPRGPVADVVLAGGVVAEIACGASDSGAAEVVDLDGRVILPGLWDAHVHAVQWALAQQRIDVSGAGSAAEAVTLAAASAPVGTGMITAYGFRDALWVDCPHKDLLQAAFPGRAVLMQSNDLHTAWFSPAALAVIGLDHPTGVLCDGESYAAVAAMSGPDRAEVDRAVLGAMRAAAARGVVGIIDFEYADNCTDWARRAAAGTLPVRVECSVPADRLGEAIGRGLRTGEALAATGGLAAPGPVKAFGDGSLNTRTAWCHQSYGRPGQSTVGHAEMPADLLAGLVRRAESAGLRCAIHAIGDRAVSAALDALEVAPAGRIEHAQLVATADLARLGRAGLVLGVQPAHQPDDRDVADRVWPRCTDRAYAYAAMLAAGGRLEFGSDAPVAPLDPWDAIASAVCRTDDGRPPWHPEQAVSLDAALVASSRGRAGIELGDPADVVVLDSELDPAELRADPVRRADRLRGMPIWATYLAGRRTYRGAA